MFIIVISDSCNFIFTETGMSCCWVFVENYWTASEHFTDGQVVATEQLIRLD